MIEWARERAERVVVFVNTRDGEAFPGMLRAGWLQQLHPEVLVVEVAHELKERFVDCLRLPGVPRQWVIDGLRETLTDWAAQAPLPAEPALKEAFREALKHVWACEPVDAVPTAVESARIADAYQDLQVEQLDLAGDAGALPAASQLKLNARSRLTVLRTAGREVCELIIDGRCIRRRALRCS